MDPITKAANLHGRSVLMIAAKRDEIVPPSAATALWEALGKPKILVGTYGSEALAVGAFAHAKKQNAALVVCFIRQVNLSFKWDQALTIDSDLAAQRTFARFLDLGHEFGGPEDHQHGEWDLPAFALGGKKERGRKKGSDHGPPIKACAARNRRNRRPRYRQPPRSTALHA